MIWLRPDPVRVFSQLELGQRKGEKEHKTTERKKQTNTNYDDEE